MMDRRGVMGLPLRLAIAFIIISICVPILAVAADHFREDTELECMRSDVDSIVRNADDLYFAGTGSSRTMSVTAEPGYEIRIGGDGADAYLICICKDGTVKDRTFAENPPVRFLGDTVSITGHSDIRMECVRENDVYGIRVSVL